MVNHFPLRFLWLFGLCALLAAPSLAAEFVRPFEPAAQSGKGKKGDPPPRPRPKPGPVEPGDDN